MLTDTVCRGMYFLKKRLTYVRKSGRIQVGKRQNSPSEDEKTPPYKLALVRGLPFMYRVG